MAVMRGIGRCLVGSVALAVAAGTTSGALSQTVTINTITLDAQDGEPLGAERQQGSLTQFFQLQKQLVYRVLSQIGVDPSLLPPDVRTQIEQPATQNLPALLALSEGLDLMDQGQFVEAKAAFDRALALDPGFTLAATLSTAMPEFNLPPDDGDAAEAQIRTAARAAAEEIAESVAEGDDPDAPESLTTPRTPPTETGPTELEGDDTTLLPPGPIEDPAASATRTDDLAINERLLSAESGEPATDAGDGQPEPEPEPQPEPEPEPEPFRPTESAPACGQGSGPCWLFTAILLREQQDGNGNASNRTLYDRAPILSERPVQATGATEPMTVVQQGSDGYLQLTQTGTVTAFREGVSGGENTSLNAGPQDTTTTASFGETSNSEPALTLGYYTYSAWTASNVDSFVYRPFNGRLWFAKGEPVTESTLADLAQSNAEYHYFGSAGADFIIVDRETTQATLQSCASCGSFDGIIDFGASRLTGMTISIDTTSAGVASDQAAQLAIQAQDISLSSTGGFHVTESTTGVTIELGRWGEPVAAHTGQVSGGVFGAFADHMGGVFSACSTSSTHDVCATGNFGGQYKPPS